MILVLLHTTNISKFSYKFMKQLFCMINYTRAHLTELNITSIKEINYMDF